MSSPAAAPHSGAPADRRAATAPAEAGSREVYWRDPGGFHATDVFPATRSRAGCVVEGPASSTSPTPRIVVPPGASGRVDRLGSIVIDVGLPADQQAAERRRGRRRRAERRSSHGHRRRNRDLLGRQVYPLHPARRADDPPVGPAAHATPTTTSTPSRTRSCATRCGTSTSSTATRSCASPGSPICAYGHDFNPVHPRRGRRASSSSARTSSTSPRPRLGGRSGRSRTARRTRASATATCSCPTTRWIGTDAPARRRRDVPGVRRRQAVLLGRQHAPPVGHRRHRPRRLQPDAPRTCSGSRPAIPPVKIVEGGADRRDIEELYRALLAHCRSSSRSTCAPRSPAATSPPARILGLVERYGAGTRQGDDAQAPGRLRGGVRRGGWRRSRTAPGPRRAGSRSRCPATAASTATA